MDTQERERNWKLWSGFTREECFEVYLHNLQIRYQIKTILAFYVTIRNGEYFQGHKIGVKLVETAFQNIDQMIVLYRKPDKKGNQGELELPIFKHINYY